MAYRIASKEALKTCLWATPLLLLSLLFQLLPLNNMLLGVYRWHLAQPETVQGGMELLGVYALCCVALILIKNRIFLVLVITGVAGLYLQLHHVLVTAVSALLYVEIIIAFGARVSRVLKLEPQDESSDYISYFIVGLLFWSLLAIALSWLGFGRFNDLRILTVCVGVLSIAKRMSPPFIVYIARAFGRSLKREQAIGLFLLILILTQLAKSTRAFDWDSIWYGLRPEHVLIGNHSFFDNLGLVDFVFYYPKLFELFAAPLGDFQSYSFMYSLNAVLLAFFLLVICRAANVLGASKPESLTITALLGSLPVISNMASTAKPDIFSSLLFVAGVYYFIRWSHNSNIRYCAIGITALILSVGGKLTSIVYMPALAVGFTLGILLFKKQVFQNKPVLATENSPGYGAGVIIVAAIATLLGTCYRTFVLTGVPIYPILGGVWQFLGFRIKYPFITEIAAEDSLLNGVPGDEIIARWYDFLFNAKELPRVIMVWPGNLFFYLLIIVFVLFLLRKIGMKPYLFLTVALMPVVVEGLYFTTSRFFFRGGDGNYYTIPNVLFTLLLFHMISGLSQNIKRCIYISLALFIPLQSTIMFVSHPSWKWGTAAFSFDLSKNLVDKNEINRGVFEKEGLLEIESYILSKGRAARAVGFGPQQTLHRLPCAYDAVKHIGSPLYGNPAIIASEMAFVRYLEWAKTDYLIRPKEVRPTDRYDSHDAVLRVYDRVEQWPGVRKIKSAKYLLLDISGVSLKDVFSSDEGR